MVDLFSATMFILSCYSGREHGSLFVGALIGCFALYTHFWGDWMLSFLTYRSRNRILQKWGVWLFLLWTAALFAASVLLPPFVLSLID